MSTYLLDVNVLLALGDPMHVHHEAAHTWFADRGAQAWATCPLTENGFVRIASHPSYPNRPGDVSAALGLLDRLCQAEGHRFWTQDISIRGILRSDIVISHSHVTDVYLLGLAIHMKGVLATLDQRLPADRVEGGAAALELIPA
ncbi:MAG: TA system VapC family ribonuclease toxin [Anaerolineales bacterium]